VLRSLVVVVVTVVVQRNEIVASFCKGAARSARGIVETPSEFVIGDARTDLMVIYETRGPQTTSREQSRFLCSLSRSRLISYARKSETIRNIRRSRKMREREKYQTNDRGFNFR
jgi:hypothetical protein